MTKETKLLHVALHFTNRKQAEIFFTKVLKIPFKKSFTLSSKLSNDIFGINNEVIVDAYANENSYFEVFITDKIKKESYEHVCIEIENKEEFIKRCRQNNIEPIFVKKDERTLLFIEDYSGNLYEIKEKIG